MAAPTSTSTMRYVRGSMDAASYPAASGQQINVGDLVYLRSGDVCPISAFPLLSGPEIQSWSGARAGFLGVSLSQWNSTSTISGNVTVAHNGFFSFPFGSPAGNSGVTTQPGAFVGFTQDTCSGYFHPQRLMQCSGQATGIGKVVDQTTPTASGLGSLTVYLQSTVVKGVIAGV